MKYIKSLSLAVVISMSSCGTKHQVITKSGEIYEVQGDKYYKEGKEVTAVISMEEKDRINAKLNRQLEAEAELEAQQETLEQAREEAEQALEEASEKAAALEAELEAKQQAREDFLAANEDLKDAQKKYHKLRKKGKLSPSDEAKWTEKLNDLSTEVKLAEKALNAM
ncbi:hypothetical protein ACW5R3_02810 [Bizionia sp. KMM 8389]